MDLLTPLKYIKGVGPARAEQLAAKGLETVEDILLYAPFRYEDRRNVKTLDKLAPGEMATVVAEVRSTKMAGFGRRRNLGVFTATFTDESRALLKAKWFHGGYLAEIFQPGLKVALFGKVEFDNYSGELAMTHPDYEILPEDEEDSGLHTGRVVPVHEGTGKITARMLRAIVHRALEGVRGMPEHLPAGIRERLKLPERWAAVRELHFPPPEADARLLNAFRSPAQFRMIFEEFFWLETGLALKKARAKVRQGIAFELNDRVRARVKTMLPFKPTGAQKRVLGEIAQDMARPVPMYRLLQGDVGSGKTLVAAEAAIIAIENGYQVAVLAPTEILAQQHFFYFKRLFRDLNYTPVLLTGSSSAREKTQLKKLIAAGLTQIVIGTHAILEPDVAFQRLGLAIIDEQHRFGVEQRLKLVEKGASNIDVLVMTATPIPRTLALTVYGDLDVSVIDELPPGRKHIVTKSVTEEKLEQVWSFVKKQIELGRQAYVVYPVIEESEAMKAAQKMHEHLSRIVFPDLAVGLLHGKMTPSDKEAAMDRFQRGETKILVATTVIEVGVDVPNATVMVIEHAERFGLAQLHQLRGRVGRGAEQSYCLLVTGRMNDVARERVRTMVDSNDGFHIAEMDMKLRGPGEFFGTKQSGLPALRIGNIVRDGDILELARNEATAFVEHPPSEPEMRRAVEYLRDHWQRRYGLVLVG